MVTIRRTSINIRGLQDFGRVAVVVDGARQNYPAHRPYLERFVLSQSRADRRYRHHARPHRKRLWIWRYRRRGRRSVPGYSGRRAARRTLGRRC